MLKNENGYVLGATLLILCILTLIGTAGIRTSVTELQISTNHYIMHKNFYAAESGVATTPLWLKENLEESEYMDIHYLGVFSKADFVSDPNFMKNNDFSVEIVHKTGIDPFDGIEKVLLYGDENGDYLNEINFTTGIPLEISTSKGTHVRGGLSVIETTWVWEYIFAMPDAALRVYNNVNGNGVSGSIIGEHTSGSSCGDVADIMYDVAGGTIDYGGSLGDTPLITQSAGMYPYPILKPILEKNATQILTPVNGKNDPSEVITSSDDPGIVVITSDTKITNLTGYGILVVDGVFEIAGNLDWHGLILVGGDMVLSGGGSKVIYGSVIGMGDAVAINGSVDIQYDCDYLNLLKDKFSGYRMTSWRQK
jgi:hypothetical protein